MGPGPMQHLQLTKLTSTTTDPLSLSLCASTSPDFLFPVKLADVIALASALEPAFFFFLVSLSRSRSLSSKVLQPPHHHWYFQHVVVVVFRLSDSVCICYNAHTRLLYIHYFSLFDIFSQLSLLLLVLSLFPFSLRMCWRATGRIWLTPLSTLEEKHWL